MTITINEFGEISNPENFEPPKTLKLKPCHTSCMHIPPEPPKKKRCKECHRLFKPSSERQIFCNSKCGARYRRRLCKND